MKYKYVWLGQSILKFEVPLDIFTTINQVYEKNFNKLHKANKQLVGKIENEHSLYYNGIESDKMTKHNTLPNNVIEWFYSVFRFYLKANKIERYQLKVASIWVNEMKDNEYNPIHWHGGHISGAGFLKVPKTLGTFVQDKGDKPYKGGMLNLLHGSRQFLSHSIFQIKPKVGNFYLFPNYMMHAVYPFADTNEERRSVSFNAKIDEDAAKLR